VFWFTFASRGVIVAWRGVAGGMRRRAEREEEDGAREGEKTREGEGGRERGRVRHNDA
jgi:hypothetical protein